jgi:hypothetical protein
MCLDIANVILGASSQGPGTGARRRVVKPAQNLVPGSWSLAPNIVTYVLLPTILLHHRCALRVAVCD